MSYESDLRTKFKETRRLLNDPAKAVFDDGINLRRRPVQRKKFTPIKVIPIVGSSAPRPALMIRRAITVGAVIRAASTYFDLPVKDMRSPKRGKLAVRVRHLVMYLSEKHCKASSIYTGRMLGGRDHSTVIYGRKAVNRLVAQNDPETVKDLIELEKVLYAGLEGYRSPFTNAAIGEPAVHEPDAPQEPGDPERRVQGVDQAGWGSLAYAEAKTVPEIAPAGAV